MSYVWETDNLVKEFTLSGGLFKPKHLFLGLVWGKNRDTIYPISKGFSK